MWTGRNRKTQSQVDEAADKVGGFIGQARAFEIEVDLSRPRPATDDPSEFDRSFLDLSGIAVRRDAWAGRDLVGEDLARWGQLNT